jgi:hypothetical protein
MYRSVARSLGLETVDQQARLFVVTDLPELQRIQASLPAARWEGNIAIRDL